ncbi:MAG: thioredoxin [Dehalococcoidia bacterium]|jgi:thioredoxin 1
MASVRDVTDATFNKEVLGSTLPVLVDFWAPWCGPCRMVSPLVEELAGDFAGKMDFVKLNTDESPATAMSYGIRSIPTLIIFKAGQPVGQVIGFRPKAELKKHIESAIT